MDILSKMLDKYIIYAILFYRFFFLKRKNLENLILKFLKGDVRQ